MGNIKDLSNKEAVAKIKELATAENICIFTSDLDKRPVSARPMGTADVDDEGNIWFMSKASSLKNDEIKDDSEVQLYYSNKSSAEFLSVYGRAAIIKDKNKAEEVWKPLAKAWFKEGIDDPELTLIKVTPLDSYYWDTQSGKLVTLLKIAVAAITGKEMDGGVEGKLHV